MEIKYRILYDDQKVVNVTEDQGTVYLGDGSGLMVLVDTKENAKTMLSTIGINTSVIDGGSYMPAVGLVPSVTGLDYLDQINRLTDPTGVLGDIV